MKLQYEGQTIYFNVEYGKGEKLSLLMDTTGHITVKVPKGTDEETILDLVKSQGKAILKRLENIEKVKELQKPKVYDEYEEFLYLGKKYTLNQLFDTTDLSKAELHEALKKFYISSCKKVITERLKSFQKQLSVKPNSIDIVESETQWGSCTWDKKISFNYKLIMAPVDLIDYVIVHELCHLLHMNHDRSFWRKVGSIIPDYKDKQNQLARYGNFMTL